MAEDGTSLSDAMWNRQISMIPTSTPSRFETFDHTSWEQGGDPQHRELPTRTMQTTLTSAPAEFGEMVSKKGDGLFLRDSDAIPDVAAYRTRMMQGSSERMLPTSTRQIARENAQRAAEEEKDRFAKMTDGMYFEPAN